MFFSRQGKTESVAKRLWALNGLIVFTAVTSLFVCYELNKGATLQELNYYHIKYNQVFTAEAETFKKAEATDLEPLKNSVLSIREQPEACLREMGLLEKIFLNMIGSGDAIDLCQNDIAVADDVLESINRFDSGEISRDALIKDIDYSIEKFQYHSDKFAPTVKRVVNRLFLFILLFSFLKAFSVIVSGIYLGQKVTDDYEKLERTETLLKKSEQRYVLAAEGTNDGLWDWDILTNAVYFSPRFKKLLGYSVDDEEKFPPRLKTFEDNIHPDDYDEVMQHLQEHLTSRIPYMTEYRLKHKEGYYRWFLVKGKAVWGEDGNATRMAGSISDITDRKLYEQALISNQQEIERLAVFPENNPNYVLSFDKNMSIKYLNPACHKLMEDSDEVGKDTFRLLPLNMPAIINTCLEDRTQKVIGELESEEGCNIAWTFQAMPNQDIINGYGFDITDRLESQKKLRESNEKLLKSNKELEHFASIASHDLKEPLRKIRSYGSMLELEMEDTHQTDREASIKYLSRITSSAARMEVLIDGLLAYSRISTQKKEFQSVNLNDVLNGVISDLEMLIKETQARIDVGPLSTIQADGLQMRQVFQNLMTNSLKFHRADVPPVIKITETSTYKERVITVADNGIGFDEKYADKIFEVFQRLHGKTEYEGTGIGLSVCKKIMERHDGYVTVDSALNEGAAFHLHLPIN